MVVSMVGALPDQSARSLARAAFVVLLHSVLC